MRRLLNILPPDIGGYFVSGFIWASKACLRSDAVTRDDLGKILRVLLLGKEIAKEEGNQISLLRGWFQVSIANTISPIKLFN